MADGCLSKLTIIESSNRATQYKKTVDALPVYCADKGYWFVDGIICKDTEQTEADFEEPYLNIALWLTMYHVKIETVDPLAVPATDGSHTPIKQMVEKIHVFNANIQKKLLHVYYLMTE